MQMNHALAVNDACTARRATGASRLLAGRTVESDAEILDKSKLRSPIDGVVAPPRGAWFAGRQLALGDSVAEVVDTSRVIVDVAIDGDAGLQLRRPP